MSDKKPPPTIYEEGGGAAPGGGGGAPPQRPEAPGLIPPMPRMAGGIPRASGPKTILEGDEEAGLTDKLGRLMGFLVVTASKDEDDHHYFRLGTGVNRIGHFGSRAEVELRDREVSTEHAILVCTNSATRLVDMDSTNGMKVNGKKAEYAELSTGDTIKVGRTELTFVPFTFIAED